MHKKRSADTAETHENEDSFGIFLPALGHLVVFILCALEYMEKRGPELSPKLDSPCDGCDCSFRAGAGWLSGRLAKYAGEFF
jgi:hypothetical protein